MQNEASDGLLECFAMVYVVAPVGQGVIPVAAFTVCAGLPARSTLTCARGEQLCTELSRSAQLFDNEAVLDALEDAVASL